MTTENNKIIAKFMGCENPQAWEDDLYHYDWNWLIDVVEKIESLSINEENYSFYFGISSIGASIFSKTKQGYPTQIVNFDANLKVTKKEAVYNACLEFINWYNKQ